VRMRWVRSIMISWLACKPASCQLCTGCAGSSFLGQLAPCGLEFPRARLDVRPVRIGLRTFGDAGAGGAAGDAGRKIGRGVLEHIIPGGGLLADRFSKRLVRWIAVVVLVSPRGRASTDAG